MSNRAVVFLPKEPRKIHLQGYYSNVSTFGDTVVVKAIDLDSPGI
jgi:hypothetical protein